MKLLDLEGREGATPWVGDGKIPWHDPAFSKRMLREHLSQEHDRASRQFATIDQHVSWIHDEILHATEARVLDFGCGPGFYTGRLARLGHTCLGIDFSPASIAYAQAEAKREDLACEYRLEDLRKAEFGTGFDAALFIFGELNTFPPSDAQTILARARRALSSSGVLVLEVHSEQLVRSLGEQAPMWFTAHQSVFSDEPHLCLKECTWHSEARATTEQYFVVSLRSAEVTRYVSTTQAYSDAEYACLLHEAGFGAVEHYASLSGDRAEGDQNLLVLVARSK